MRCSWLFGMSIQEEYEEFKKLAQKAGVADVSKAYNEYYKLTQLATMPLIKWNQKLAIAQLINPHKT